MALEAGGIKTMKFMVYEVWTTALVVEADNEAQALLDHLPIPREGLNLCNWHAVEIPVPSEKRHMEIVSSK